MTRDFLQSPVRAALYILAFVGVVAVLLDLLIGSAVLFTIGSELIGVSFLGWGFSYLTAAEWTRPDERRQEARWVGYLFVAMGGFTLGLLLADWLAG